MRCSYLLIGGLWILAVRLPASEEFFEKEIRPALIEHCYKCHSADAEKIKGGLRVDSRAGLLTGGDSGPAIVPGKPDESLLIKAVRRLDKDLAMPPKKELPESIINAFVEWVRIGAPDPRTETAKAAPRPPAEEKPPIDYAAARKSWAFRKPVRPVVPNIRNESWSQHPIDRFIGAQLEEKQLIPAGRADKRALIRRATFDLTGLPPTQGEVEAFVRDDSSEAFAHVIDRLLASPHYGERWARHWLDVVRYTDSFDARGAGGPRNGDCTEAWRYRDWVVDRLNADFPYDDFILHQVAGDILAAQEFDAAKIVATGVYAIGNWGGGDADKEKLLTDIVDDQIDLTGRAFLGLTMACARCHDHKFDPISAEDYYGLAGIFFSSHILPSPGPKTGGPDMLRISLLRPEERRLRDETRKRVGAIDAELARGLRRMTRVRRDVDGKAGLIGWQVPELDNPSLTVNSSPAEIAFSTIKLPGRSIALHPGPSMPATAAWRSPISGPITVRARLRDVDPNCGDGIAWEVRHGKTSLASGNIENGGETTVAEQRLIVEPGDLVQLLIRPRREYSCDATQLELTVRSAADEQTWDLRETVLADPANVAHGVWAICAGDGERLTEDLPSHAALLVERAALAAKLAAPEPLAHGLQEGGCPESAHVGVHDVKVHIRGRYDRLGPLVPRRFPKLLAGDTPTPIHEGSGRMALARWIANENNPLTARVMVNRVWQHHFGEAIVRTANNFGKLGIPPTHPELLDWLTCEFVRTGWSLKKLHRLIMSSATYQQSTVGDSETRRRDPDNLMFGRMNRRRLDAESIRDSLLTASGKLDRQRGGPAVPALDSPRRTLYLLTVRSDQTTYRSLFDAPDPSAIIEKRIDSTVAPQALFFLNDPFVLGQARGLHERLDREVASSDPAPRIEWLYRELLARPPRSEEIKVGRTALETLREQGADAWTLYCQTLLAGAEFVYLD